jgi:hypothetical protein
MTLSKMKPSSFEYACKVTLLVKKYDSWHFYGNYMPLNLQIEQDSFPMALVEDVLMQLGKTQWFSTLDLQFGFWRIKMELKDIHKSMLITKSGVFD